MNTQAIKIIDEMIEELRKVSFPSEKVVSWVIYLKKARDKISSLPSLNIDSLQRYDFGYDWYEESDEWDWIKYDDLKKLLQDTLELNQ